MFIWITAPSVVKSQVIELSDGEYYAIKQLGKYSVTNATQATQKLLGVSAANARRVVDTLVRMP